MGLFGGLVGGPIASLLDYHAPPGKTSGYSSFQISLDLHAPVLWYIMEDQGNRNDDRKLCRHF